MQEPVEAALAAIAQESVPPGRTMTVEASGRVLVVGPARHAVFAARALADRRQVTVLLTDQSEHSQGGREDQAESFAVHIGKPAQLKGHFGAWRLTVRETGAELHADSVLDLSRNPALIPAPELRVGYVRCDPRNRAELETALDAVANCDGEFQHPLYVETRSELCAHSRSQIQGCTRCLDLCPPGALSPAGDHVSLDPHVCAGCGACTAACPTGALRFDQPNEESSLRGLQSGLRAWTDVSEVAPTVVFHGVGFGVDLLEAAAAPVGRLPLHVLPRLSGAVAGVSAETLWMALAWGAGHIVCVADPARSDTHGPLAVQLEIANTFTSALGYGARASQTVTGDPDELFSVLVNARDGRPWPVAEFLSLGERRDGGLQAMRHLGVHSPAKPETIPLPAAAPFGTVRVDPKACTLCLACVGACPTGALQDNPDAPQLSFQEDACIQCGLCRATCPEQAISLQSRFVLETPAGARKILHEEEPFACVSCGKPFGVRQSIERTMERLSAHPMMMAHPRLAQRIKMCADCRVVDEFRVPLGFQGKPRPRVRTTDDYRSGVGSSGRDASLDGNDE